MEKRVLLFLALFFGLQTAGFLQHNVVDSLENLLHVHTKQDTMRINLLNDLAFACRNIDPEKTFQYATEANELSEALGYKKGQAESLRIMGIYHRAKSNDSLALKNYQMAYLLFEKLGDQKGMALCYNNIGSYHLGLAEYPQALDYFHKHLEIVKEMGDDVEVAKCYHNIGSVFFSQGNYNESFDNYEKSIEIRERTGDKIGLAVSYHGIASVFYKVGTYHYALDYLFKALKIFEEENHKRGIIHCFNTIASIYSEEGDYHKALDYYQKSIEIGEDIGDKRIMATNFNNIGNIHKKQDDNQTALIYYLKALEIRQDIKDNQGEASCFINIGNVFSDLGNFQEAEGHYSTALRISAEIGSKSNTARSLKGLGELFQKQQRFAEAKINITNAYKIADEIGETKLIHETSKTLSDLFAQSGRFDEAYRYHVIYQITGDSLINVDKTKEIVRLEYDYKFDKERELNRVEQEKRDFIHSQEMKRQRNIQFTFISGLLLVLMLLALVYYNLVQKRKTNQILTAQKKEIEARVKEKELMLRELHHRVKNNLQVVYSMLNIQSRQLKDKEAAEALQSSNHRIWAMALVHHKLYLDEKLTQINMNGYIRDLANNILETITDTDNAIKTVFKVEDITLEADYAIPIGLITNELIINAIKHAFKNIAEPRLTVSLYHNSENELALQVSDNGTGLPDDFNLSSNGSFGLELITLLTKQLNAKFEIANNNGACFTLTLPRI
jgi:two-component system, sensor histidine kinase PdtaS